MKNWDNCKEFLENNNAPKRLVRHLEIVSSVAQEICDYILNIGIPLQYPSYCNTQPLVAGSEPNKCFQIFLISYMLEK